MPNVIVLILVLLLGVGSGYFLGRPSKPVSVDVNESIPDGKPTNALAPAAEIKQNNNSQPPTSASSPAVAVPRYSGPSREKLIEDLTSLPFLEMQKICRDGEEEWLKKTLDTHAESDKANRDRRMKMVSDTVRDMAQRSLWWKAQIMIDEADHNLTVEAFINFYNGKTGSGDSDRDQALGQYNKSDDFCWILSPAFIIDGKSVSGNGSMSSCGEPGYSKGENVFISWITYSDRNIAPVMSLVLFPLPSSKSAGLDYFATKQGNWITRNDFVWSPASKQEFESARNRWEKMLEE